MKLVFSAFGTGLGHATRTLAIIKKLKKAEIKTAAYGDAFEYFKKAGLSPTQMRGMRFAHQQFNFNFLHSITKNMRLPITFINDYKTLSKLFDDFEPDAVISDSEPISFLSAKIKGKKTVMVLNILSVLHEKKRFEELHSLASQIYTIQKIEDNLLRHCDLMIIPSLYNYETQTSKMKIINPVLRCNPTDYKEKEIKEKLKIEDEFYLVSIGGAEMTKGSYFSFLRVLPKFDDKLFIMASNYCTRRKIRYKNIIIYPYLDNFLEYLKTCRAYIGTAGLQTISEALAFKKPMFIIPVENHVEQLTNALVTQNMGLSHSYLEKKFTDKKLEKNMEYFFIDEEEIRENTIKARIKFQGAAQAAKLIQELAD